MLGKLRLYDYRCFRREAPATLEIHEGFTSFLGPNNAGKSALIRTPYEIRSVVWLLTGYLSGSNYHGLFANQSGWNVSPGLYERGEIISERRLPQCAVEFEPAIEQHGEYQAVSRLRVEFDEAGEGFNCKIFDLDGTLINGEGSPSINGFNNELLSTQAGLSISTRSLKKFLDQLAGVQYFGPFRNAINEGGGNHFDMQVGTGFIAQWNHWKTGAGRPSNRGVLRVTEDVRRLIGARHLDIAATSDGKSLQVTLDQRPHKLQELGAGFSQMVIVLANAMVKQPSLVIIDEPELHLHPSLQAEFLTALASYSKYGVIYATHSVGLARQSADRCFTVQRLGEGSIVRAFDRTPDLAEFLGSLGIAGLQELGWNTILLVEGVCDVRTAQALLRLYEKDQRVVVLPLGGDALANGKRTTELSEILRLAGTQGKVAALVDSERESNEAAPIKSRRAFSETCTALGIFVCITERRAIENYISQSALDEAFDPVRHVALGPYETSSQASWGKGETWRAAKVMTRSELNGTDVGTFFEAL